MTVPTAVFLFTTWPLHVRFHLGDVLARAVLPTGALPVPPCAFAGPAAVPAAGGVAAAAVTLATVTPVRDSGRGARAR